MYETAGFDVEDEIADKRDAMIDSLEQRLIAQAKLKFICSEMAN